MSNGNGNGNVKVPRWAWGGIATLISIFLAGSVTWARYITVTLIAIEARMSIIDRNTAVIDDLRARGYTGYTITELGPRLTKIEMQLERLMDDMRHASRTKMVKE